MNNTVITNHKFLCPVNKNSLTLHKDFRMNDKEFITMLSELKKIVKEVSGKISEDKLIALISLSAKAQLKLKHNCAEVNGDIVNKMKTEIMKYAAGCKTLDVKRETSNVKRETNLLFNI